MSAIRTLSLVGSTKPFNLCRSHARSPIEALAPHRTQQRVIGSSMSQRRRYAGAAHAGGSGSGGGSSEGSRLAEDLVEQAEEQVERLERRAGFEGAEAHLGPAPVGTEKEEANVWYFAYGSNINKKVFEGRRMIKPAESLPAMLPNWRLEFSQPGLPYTEPAFAAVVRQPEASAPPALMVTSNGSSSSSSGMHAWPDVHGVLHRITPSQWSYVLETEGASEKEGEESGYAVVKATAVTYDGRELEGVKTLTVPAHVKDRLKGRVGLPSKRYLTLIRDGALDYGLTPEYQAWLQQLAHYEAVQPGQKVGAILFRVFAFSLIFPVWGGVRLLRKATGMQAADSGDMAGRFMRSYTAAMFTAMMGMHEVVRPVLGCGVTSAGIGVGGSGSDGGKLQ